MTWKSSWPPPAEEVVATYLDAIGGSDTIKAIESKRMTYWVHMFGRDAYIMERLWTRPNTMRSGRPGATAYTVMEGEKSWRVGPEGRKALPEGVAGSLSKIADIDGPLVDAAKKNIKLAYSGIVRFDMAELHHLTLTFSDSVQWEFFFDSRTGLLQRAGCSHILLRLSSCRSSVVSPLLDTGHRGPYASLRYRGYQAGRVVLS